MRAYECYKKKLKVSSVKEQNNGFVALIVPNLEYGMLYLPPTPPPTPPFPLDMACGLGKLLTNN